MQKLKRAGAAVSEPVDLAYAVDGDIADAGLLDDRDDRDDEEFDTFGMYRVICPACTQPIALLADEDTLPEHAMCPTRWNPFVLAVCSGTGSPAATARPADEQGVVQEQDAGLLLTLPQGLDWRMQPFSHVGGPGSRPMKSPLPRLSEAA
jgi:hypothetical protein